MIDIHHHCLPDVDDGPRDWQEAVEMCRMAADEGIETIVATPHVLRGRWRTATRAELESRLETLQHRVGGTLRLLLGSEYFFGHDMAEVLRRGNTIIPLAGSRYFLTELAANSVPPLFEQPLYRTLLEGWIPVIAHPERNVVLQSRPELLAEYIRNGARVQITAGSITGAFGAAARRAAELFLRRRLVHFVATDAHNMSKRPPRVREALDALRQLTDAETVHALTRANPLAVIERRGLPWEPDPVAEPAPGFLSRLRSYFPSRHA